MSDDQDRSFAALAEEVQRLKDVNEIMQLKARYCRCVDVKDWAGFAECLTEDHELVGDGHVITGRDDVVRYVKAVLGDAMSVHHAHSPEIEITGPDTATATWAKNGYVIMPNDGSPFVFRGYGHYHEECVRGAQGWQIRRCVESNLRVDTEGELPTYVAAANQHSG